MKRTVTICLDEEVTDYLKNVGNKSEFINGLIIEHRAHKGFEYMDAEELKLFIAKERAKEEYEIKLKEIDYEFTLHSRAKTEQLTE